MDSLLSRGKIKGSDNGTVRGERSMRVSFRLFRKKNGSNGFLIRMSIFYVYQRAKEKGREYPICEKYA